VIVAIADEVNKLPGQKEGEKKEQKHFFGEKTKER
jgi:hypothetical protein